MLEYCNCSKSASEVLFRLLCLQNDAAEFTIAVVTAVTIVELPIKLSRNFLVAKNFVKLVRRSQIQLQGGLTTGGGIVVPEEEDRGRDVGGEMGMIGSW